MNESVVIVAASAVTPAGLSLRETAASARARTAMLGEIEWRDRRFEPFVVGTVPDEGLPPLDPVIEKAMPQYREARMLRLAHVALEEVLAPLKEPGPVPLLLGLSEHHTTLPIETGRFLLRLQQQSGAPLDIQHSMAVAKGRAAGLMALRQAARLVSQSRTPFVLVGGVDCLVDLYVLGTLDLEQRVRGETVSDGFSPAEGAAFLLLCTQDTAESHGLKPLSRILGAALGREPGHLYSQEPYLGEGLAATFTGLFSESPPPARIASVFASFNGERYWGREYSVARLRHADVFEENPQMEHPAEVFGDLGAAHGPALAAIAAHALYDGYVRAPCLVYASSDRGERAAALLARAA